MDFKRQSIENYLLYETPIENIFISEYMSDARGDYVKLYLLALMYAETDQPFDNESLAKALGCSLELVLEGWDYWESKGIVEKNIPDSSNPDKFGIVFKNLKEEVFGRGSKPRRQSFANVLDDKQFSRLLKDVELACGRLLESGEAEQISAWITEYSMNPDLILFGYKYSAENRKSTKYRYVGAILKDWRAKGLTNKSQVEAYLEENDKHYDLYKRIFKELGFHRSPTEPEKIIMNSWLDQLGYSLDKILEACKKTSGIPNPNINYVNSVLTAWYNEEQRSGKDQSEESIFAKVNALYEKERAENAQKTKELRSKITSEIPRIAEIMTEIREAGIESAKLALSGRTDAVRARKKKMAELYQERAKLLTAHGYKETDMDAIYTCSKCKDTGVLEDGSRCSCFDEKAAMLQNKKDN